MNLKISLSYITAILLWCVADQPPIEKQLSRINTARSLRNHTHSRNLFCISPTLTTQSFTINPSDQRLLKTKLLKLSSPLIHQEQFITQASHIFVDTIPTQFIQTIQSLLKPSAPPVLLLRGLPIDDKLPDTPKDGVLPSDKKTFVSEGVLLGIAAILGAPFGFSREKNGALIHMICPESGKEQSQSSIGSKSDLKFHTENAYLDFRPQFIILIGLRADHDQQAQTTFIDARKLLSVLNTQQRDLLKQPFYQCKVGESFQATAESWSRARPILQGDEQTAELLLYEIAMRVDPNLPVAIQQKANLALQQLYTHLKSDSPLIESHRITPGDVLIINNRAAIHGRTAFTPQVTNSYNTTNRWLERVYITKAAMLHSQKTLPSNRRIVDAHMIEN